MVRASTLSAKGFKGIGGEKHRSLALWLKMPPFHQRNLGFLGRTRERTGWDFSVENGRLKLDVGGGQLTGGTILNDDAWHHVGLVFPSIGTGVEDVVLYVDGSVENNPIMNARVINTGDQYDFRVGTNENGNHFNGMIDEVRLYEKDLSSNEMASIFLNGTMRFQTSAVSLPPVSRFRVLPPAGGGTATVTGDLVAFDSTQPVVRIYWGNEDGGYERCTIGIIR